MATSSIPGNYFVYENRLASFQIPHPIAKRRTSNASSRAPKALSWPHKFLPPFELAKAGFFFHPTPSNPDNVACFLCNKNIDGWEEDDNPVEEHLKHSPSCGWAVTAAVEAEVEGLDKVDPRDARLLEARKATFAGQWPYETKRGWKCKTKQLAEAGWIFAPTNESDDNTTCAYCQLMLDEWAPGDKPMDEHYKRSPDCPFFELINKNPAPPKKGAKTKAVRGSKVSRMSMQSVATAASDLTAGADHAADVDDSVMTTASVMTQSSKKTATRAKRAPTASRARKTKAKKDDAVTAQEDVDPLEANMPPPPPPPKAARGKKRGSDAVEDSVLTNAEAPAPKKRATRGRGSQLAEASVLTTASQDVDMGDAPALTKAAPGRKKAAASKTRARKGSAVSVASTASTASLRARSRIPDDDELDRQLQADLDRPLTDDEDLAADSESERRKVPVAAKGKKATKHETTKGNGLKSDYAMFDPAPAQPDEAAIEADLRAMEVEMTVEETRTQEISVPKKGRKPAAPRKVSRQVKKGKAIAQSGPEPEPELEVLRQLEPEPTPAKQLAEEAEEFHDASQALDASSATVINGGSAGQAKKGRGRPKKVSASQTANEDITPRVSVRAEQEVASEPPPEQSEPSLARDANFEIHEAEDEVPAEATSVTATFSSPLVEPKQPPRPLPQPPARSSSSRPLPVPSTPRANHISPAPSAKQPVLSPSQSPQSSDAENQPPSSRPAMSAMANRIALAPQQVVSQTPMRRGVGPLGSPSRRNVGGATTTICGVQSTVPWTDVDLEMVLADLEGYGADKENAAGGGAPYGALSTPERNMTVTEWVYRVAGQAEQRLKHECEAMVGAFEREGGRAIRSLEGLVVEN